MANWQWHKVPKFPRPHAPIAHRPPLPPATSTEHGADGKGQNNSQPPGMLVFVRNCHGGCPGNINHPSPASPGQNQIRVAVVWLAVTALFMPKGVLSRCQKKGRPGCHPRHACGQASPTSRVPKSPCWRWLHGAGICGESREKHRGNITKLPNMSILDPESGRSC